jgi:hypothetical protein
MTFEGYRSFFLSWVLRLESHPARHDDAGPEYQPGYFAFGSVLEGQGVPEGSSGASRMRYVYWKKKEIATGRF